MAPVNDPKSAGRINFLNVGTKILLKDTMDQYLRTLGNLGDYKTFYASNMASSLRVFAENNIQVLITEAELEDASAYRLLQNVGGVGHEDDLFIILALSEKSDHFMALATELEAHAVLVKPFTAVDLKVLVEQYKTWKVTPKEPWRVQIRQAHIAIRDKRYPDAEEHFSAAMKAAPNNPAPYAKAGFYFLMKPEYGLAENSFKNALQIKPEHVQSLHGLGLVYLGKKDFEKAEIYLKKANSISPMNPDRIIELVRLYIERGMEACKSSLKIDPSCIQAQVMLGKLLAVQKDYIGVIRELDKVIGSLRETQRLEAQTFMALAKKLGGLKS